MPARWMPQSDFSTGEMDPRLFGRVEIERRANAVEKARNVLLAKSGAPFRRPGWRYRPWGNTGSAKRLISWEHETGAYLLRLFDQGSWDILDMSGTVVATLGGGPWDASSIGEVDWASNRDIIFITHEDFIAQQIDRDVTGSWTRQTMVIFVRPGGDRYWPFFKFAPASVELTPSATTGNITLTTSEPHWKTTHTSGRVRYKGKHISITGFVSSTVINGTVVNTLPAADPTTDWDETWFATSGQWGFPRSIAIHQGRLWFGGIRDRRNLLQASVSGSAFLTAFNQVAGGLVTDDRSFNLVINANESSAVQALRSQGPLVILAEGAEFIIAELPVTPTNVSVQRQSSQGAELLRPAEIDGAILFIRRAVGEGEQPLIHYSFDELKQQYVPVDVSLIGQHLIDSPVDMVAQTGSSIDGNNRVFIVNADGTLAVMHAPDQQRPGFTLLEGEVEPYSLAVVEGRLFAAADFNGQAGRLFELDPAAELDASVAFFQSLIFSDDFNRGDENLEASADWTRIGGSAGAAKVSGNQLAIDGSLGEAAYVCPDLGSADHYTEVELRTATGHDYFECCVRVTDADNFVGLRVNGSDQWDLFERVSGAFNNLANVSSPTPQVGDNMRVEALDDEVWVYVNGNLIIGPVTIDGSLTSTRQGLVSTSDSNDPAIDNFRAVAPDVADPRSTITGLDHLDGLEVTVKADGGAKVFTGLSVASGQVTVPEAVTTGEVGLPFEWSVRLLEPEPVGQTIGSLKSMVEVRADLLDSLAVKVRVVDDDGDAVELGPLTEKVGTPPALVTGNVRAHLAGAGWGESLRLELYGDEPWPAMIRSLNTRVEF